MKKKNVLVSFSREKQVANLAGGVCLSPFFFFFLFLKFASARLESLWKRLDKHKTEQNWEKKREKRDKKDET